MKIIRLVPTLIIVLLLGSCSGDSGLSGTYKGNVNGKPAVMTIKSDGSSLTGAIIMGSYRYGLTGKVNGSAVSGYMTDANGKAVNMTMQGLDNRLIMVLIVKHPATGQIVRRVPLTFTRGAGGSAPGRQTGNVASSNSGQLDRSLVGRWRYSKIYRSGSFSTTTTRYLSMLGNGTYQYGGGRLYVSDVNASGRSGRSNVQTGNWKTANNIIYVKGQGSSNWQAYARYFVKGNSMMMTFGNGKRQLWKRY